MQSVLGTNSGLSDKDIKDALWYYYFDEEKTISYLLDQQHKKNAAKEKAEAGKHVVPLSLLPFPPPNRIPLSVIRPSIRF